MTSNEWSCVYRSRQNTLTTILRDDLEATKTTYTFTSTKDLHPGFAVR